MGISDEFSGERGWKFSDVMIRELNPERIEGTEDLYWLTFNQEHPELDEFSLSSYHIGQQFDFFDEQTGDRGKFEVLERDGYRIKIKILD